MSNNNTFHSHALGVTGFLGGITIASMVLIMQIHDEIEYSEWLIPGIAIVGVFFIIATIGMIHVASNEKESGKQFAKLMQRIATLGFFSMMVVLPFMVFPFSGIGAIVLGIIEGVIMILFVSKKGK